MDGSLGFCVDVPQVSPGLSKRSGGSRCGAPRGRARGAGGDGGGEGEAPRSQRVKALSRNLAASPRPPVSAPPTGTPDRYRWLGRAGIPPARRTLPGGWPAAGRRRRAGGGNAFGGGGGGRGTHRAEGGVRRGGGPGDARQRRGRDRGRLARDPHHISPGPLDFLPPPLASDVALPPASPALSRRPLSLRPRPTHAPGRAPALPFAPNGLRLPGAPPRAAPGRRRQAGDGGALARRGERRGPAPPPGDAAAAAAAP